MPFRENRLRATAVVFGIAALLFYAYHQYEFYQTDAKNTRQQLQVNTLRDQLPNLDESLTMSARMYVLTGKPTWKQRYNRRASRYDSTFTEINRLLAGNFAGKKELESAAANLYRLEYRALELADSNRQAEARSLLFGKDYNQHRRTFKTGLKKLNAELDTKASELILSRRTEAIESALVIGAVILLILLAWYFFSRLTRKWKDQVIEANRQRAEEAIAAERVVKDVNGQLQKANNQLRLLSAHLQEVREKERLSIANDINEELGQQLAAIKIRTGLIAQNFTAMPPPMARNLQDISDQLGTALDYLRSLAREVYPLVLRDLGLVEALEWESKRVAEQWDVQLLYSSDIEYVESDQRTAAALFRTYQEKLRSLAINGATEIVCSLSVKDNHLVLTIYDNANPNPDSKRIEEVAIEERLRSINGTLQRSSSPKEGNTCIISVPVNREGQNILLKDIY